MGAMWRVRVREDSRLGVVQVAGRLFSKRGAIEIEEARLREPYKTEIRDSPFLDVEVIAGKMPAVREEIQATEGARKLARERGIDLWEVEGTGADGQILKGDVERALQRARRDDAMQGELEQG